MKNYFVLTVMSVFVLVSGVTHAAGTQSAWSGFHVGISAGKHVTKDRKVDISGSSVITNSQPSAVPYSLSLDLDKTFGGLLGGYNWQSGAMVYGLEADYTFSEFKDDTIHSPPGGFVVTTVSASVKNLITLRGRIGYTPSNQWLFAFAGGLAAAKVKVSHNVDEFSGTGRQFYASDSEYKLGWVLGLQANYAVTRNLLIRHDYSYYDLGSSGDNRGYQTQPSSITDFADYSSIKINGSLYRLSIIYKF